MGDSVQTLPMWKKWMYALGQFGWSLASFAVGSKLVYFYLPPPGLKMGPFVVQENVLPLIRSGGVVVFGLTIIGLVFACSRLFDAVTDPLIAGLSDRSKSKLGKRRSFLAVSVLPFAALSVLVFMPPSSGITTLNTVWLFVTVLLFYWFMTMYVTPFFALLPEIGHSPNERLQLSTFISITWALGTMVGSQVELFQGMFESAGLSSTAAFQAVITIFAVVAFVFMLLPIIFIDEKKYCEPNVSKGSIFGSLVSAFKNRDFLRFTLSDLAYWVSITIINTVLVYFVTVLLGLPKETNSLLVMVMFLLSFVFYLPVNLIAKKTGKKQLLVAAFVWFLVTFLYAAFLGLYPLPPMVQGIIVAVMAAVPLAIFGIVQNAIVSDIAEADGIETGNFKAGIFFGARTFMSKLGQTVAGLIIPSLLLIGADFKASADVVIADVASGG
ncbi:MAG: MFS transporter, partial [Spirochaetes bacterium]|nr:MFS transporter [Spirochaetota bacterium]